MHILHDNTLTQDNRDKFIYIAGRYGQIVKFYNVEILCPNKIIELKNLMPGVKTTIGTFYRFMAADLLPNDIKKLIYLDSDTIINLNIAEMWQIELGEKILAAVPEFENGVPGNMHTICREGLLDGTKYFNAGVLLMNLSQLENDENNLKAGIKFIAENPKYECFDQDILNHCFLQKSVAIPKRFNILVEYARRLGDFNVEGRILHYINSSRGIGLTLNTNDSYNKIFFKYFSKTPYFDENTLGNLYGGFRQVYAQEKNFARNVSALMSGKMRTFFVSPDNADAARQIFHISSDEEIIPAVSEESLKNLMDSMKRYGGSKVFFIMINNFVLVHDLLTRAGFVFGRDYLNALEFLSDAEGVPLNSYPLFKLL